MLLNQRKVWGIKKKESDVLTVVSWEMKWDGFDVKYDVGEILVQSLGERNQGCA